MSDRYLLDTSVAGLAALYHPAIERKMAGVSRVYLPWASIGELYYGAYLYAHRNQSTKYLDIYDAFLLRMRRSLVRPNAETGQIYGAIRLVSDVPYARWAKRCGPQPAVSPWRTGCCEQSGRGAIGIANAKPARE